MAKITPLPSYAVRLAEPNDDDVYTAHREKDILIIRSANGMDAVVVALTRDNAFELAAYIQQIFTEE